MEYNRDEAVRAKEIAEKKLLERDITGAKKFALKAQSMYSELDGLSQFLEVIDLYIAFEEKVKGEMDCYRILGVDPFSEEEVLKRQYRKMAFAIHPDKNKSVGAEGAFKILSQVWDVLSNKEKKLAYDLKMNLGAPNQWGNGMHNVGICPCSSSARCTVSDTNPLHISIQPRTPTASQQFSIIQQNPRSQTPGVSSQCRCTPIHPSDPIPCTGMCIPRHQNAPINTDWSQCYAAPRQTHNPSPGTSSHHIHAQLCLLYPTPSTHCQYASSSNPHSSPNFQNSPATTISPQYFPTPKPMHHNYRNTLSGSSRHHSLRPETFWTACNRCRIQYEYQKIFLNQKLLCSQCKQPFLATEMSVPTVKGRSSCPWLFPHQQKGNSVASNGSIDIPAVKRNNLNNIRIQPSGPSLDRRSKKEVTSSMGDETLHKIVMDRENVVAARDYNAGSCSGSGERLINGRHINGLNCNGPRQVTSGSKSRLKRSLENLKGSFRAGQAVSSGCDKPQRVKELSQMEIRDMLMAKAKSEILQKVNEWKIAESKSAPVKKSKIKTSMSSLHEDLVGDLKADHSSGHLPMNHKYVSEAQGSSAFNDNDGVRANPVRTASMTVPDADFHNFDQCRTEESFHGNQVWAAYDDDDGMPRYYAVVHQVISVKPFKLQISWLNSKTASEFGSLDWIGSGFTKTSGDFRVGKYEFSTSLNSFSHQVKWRKGARGAIQVFPTKGDIWALYSNWSPDWDVLTADETVHKYNMVMILEDYNEHKGLVVAPLVKVAGFTSVFRQHLDQKEILTIPREEIFRFSHQVPHCTLNGKESENSPSGCYELDPAALPMELLKVITEAEEAEAEKIAQRPVKLTESVVERNSVEKDKPIITYSRKNKMRKMAGGRLSDLKVEKAWLLE